VKPRGVYPPPTPDQVHRFAQKLMATQSVPERLSAMEERLLAISVIFFRECIIAARVASMPPGSTLVPPITAAVIAEAARLALAAAVEVEFPLRALRGKMEES
jgi:hypothetical protein